MNPALEGQAGATSASGLSWTPKHMAERKEDGGAQTHGGLSKYLPRAWPFLWEKQGWSGAPAGPCHPRWPVQGPGLWHSTGCPWWGGTTVTHTPIPAVLGWGTRTAWGVASRGGLPCVRRGCLPAGRAAVAAGVTGWVTAPRCSPHHLPAWEWGTKLGVAPAMGGCSGAEGAVCWGAAGGKGRCWGRGAAVGVPVPPTRSCSPPGCAGLQV